MILPINDVYRLAGNQHCWTIQRTRKRKHRRTHEAVEAWEDIRWYASIEAAVNGLAELLLRTSDAQTLAEVLAEAKNVAATLGQALRPHVEVVMRGELPVSAES